MLNVNKLEVNKMAKLFMRIHGVKDIKGASQIKGIQSASKESLVEIESIEWGVEREISMDVGNGNNNDTGLLSDNNVVITKKVDGISPSLMTLLFKPVKGRVIDFILAVPNGNGAGVVEQQVFTLDDAMIVNYAVETDADKEEGSVPKEKVTIACGVIVSKFISSGIDSAFGDATAEIVSFDYNTGNLDSGVDMK